MHVLIRKLVSPSCLPGHVHARLQRASASGSETRDGMGAPRSMCLSAGVCVCVCVCVCVRTCVPAFVGENVPETACMHLCLHTHTCVCVCVCGI